MSNETKHTPGPWTIHDQIDSEGYTVIKGQGLRLAKVTNSEPDWAEANASLIAAAPELLEALKEFVRWIDNPTDDPVAKAVYIEDTQLQGVSTVIYGAIAKAEGRA